MPARDAIHHSVRSALIKDGWKITDDPYIINYDDLTLYADLAAERTLAIERGDETAVVEAKSFSGESEVHEFETALGQYLIYRILLAYIEPERQVYLSVTAKVFEEFLSRPAIQLVCRECRVAFIVIDPDSEEIQSWHQP
jgi:XisH protein